MPGNRLDAIKTALDGIEQLQRAFAFERAIFLGGAAIAILLLTAIAVRMLMSGNPSLADWAPLFGSGGLFVATGSGAMFYFNKSFELLRELAKAEANGD